MRAFRMDDRKQRLFIDRAIEPGTQVFGWEVANAAALDLLAARLEATGVAAERETAALADQRRAAGLIAFCAARNIFRIPSSQNNPPLPGTDGNLPPRPLPMIITYDTEAAARKVVKLAPRLKEAGIAVRGSAADSGNMIASSRNVRRILHEGIRRT